MAFIKQSTIPGVPSNFSPGAGGNISPLTFDRSVLPSSNGLGAASSALSGLGSAASSFSPLGAAANVVGEMGSSLINNLFAKRNARIQYEYGEKTAENAYQRQLDFWDMQNEYNSPLAQVQRIREAGLSPVEQVDTGNSSNLSSVPQGTGAQVQQTPVHFDLLGAVEQLSRIDQMQFQNTKLGAEAKQIFSQIYLNSLEGELKKAGLHEVAARVNKLGQETSNLKTEGLMLNLDYLMKAIEKNFKESKESQELENLKALENQIKHGIIQGYIGAGSDVIRSITDIGGLVFGKKAARGLLKSLENKK